MYDPLLANQSDRHPPPLPQSLSLDHLPFGKSTASLHAQNLLWRISASRLVFLLVQDLRSFPERGRCLDPTEWSLAVDPTQPAAHALLARLYARLGDPERAEKHRRLAK